VVSSAASGWIFFGSFPSQKFPVAWMQDNWECMVLPFHINPFLMLQIVDNSIKVYKGTNPEVDSYSVFWDNKKLTETTLVSQLQEKNATDIYICGLAYDVCVGRFQCNEDILILTFTPQTICCLNGMVIQQSLGSEMLGA
jgi:hypothetical protein